MQSRTRCYRREFMGGGSYPVCRSKAIQNVCSMLAGPAIKNNKIFVWHWQSWCGTDFTRDTAISTHGLTRKAFSFEQDLMMTYRVGDTLLDHAPPCHLFLLIGGRAVYTVRRIPAHLTAGPSFLQHSPSSRTFAVQWEVRKGLLACYQ